MHNVCSTHTCTLLDHGSLDGDHFSGGSRLGRRRVVGDNQVVRIVSRGFPPEMEEDLAADAAELLPEGGRHHRIDEKVHGRIDREEYFGNRPYEQDVQWESAAPVVVILFDAVEVQRLVEVKEVPRRVEHQEEGHDGEQQNGLLVLLVSLTLVGIRIIVCENKVDSAIME